MLFIQRKGCLKAYDNNCPNFVCLGSSNQEILYYHKCLIYSNKHGNKVCLSRRGD